jgi:hypothetical protein
MILQYIMGERNELRNSNNPSWMLTVPDTIFAIGAFYTSFPRSEDDPHLHSRFFDQATLFTNDVMSDCTCNNVCALLAQCFYLLAICQMERYAPSCLYYFRSL